VGADNCIRPHGVLSEWCIKSTSQGITTIGYADLQSALQLFQLIGSVSLLPESQKGKTMSSGKYEQYVVRKAMRPADLVNAGTSASMTLPPLIYLNGDEPIKGTNQFLEVVWVWADGSAGTDPERPPHSHDFNEVFLFLGADREHPEDLGAEVEFTLGTGDDAERYTLDTSGCVYIPKGIMHLPIFFRKVKRPFLMVIAGSGIGPERKF
jgi:hypothetical protein